MSYPPRTVCRRGLHALDGDNVVIVAHRSNGKIDRMCRTCYEDAVRRVYARRRDHVRADRERRGLPLSLAGYRTTWRAAVAFHGGRISGADIEAALESDPCNVPATVGPLAEWRSGMARLADGLPLMGMAHALLDNAIWNGDVAWLGDTERPVEPWSIAAVAFVLGFDVERLSRRAVELATPRAAELRRRKEASRAW